MLFLFAPKLHRAEDFYEMYVGFTAYLTLLVLFVGDKTHLLEVQRLVLQLTVSWLFW